MPDVVKGKLVWAGTAPNRVRRVVFPTKKGTSPPTPFDPDQLAAPLRAVADDEVEVELELVQGKPTKIRPVGAAWESAPPRPAAPPRPGPPHRGGPRPGPQAPPPAAPVLPGEFHNPYNFVPAPPRARLPRYDPAGDPSQDQLGDGPPVGHDRYHPDRYSGVLRVTLTTATPLLVPGAGEPLRDDPEHQSFPLRLGPDGRPYLPPTSVKGMLRAAYEAVTNSRLAVFAGWDRRLAFRRPARVEVEPAVVVAADDGRVELRILNQRWLRSPAKLPRYEPRGRPPDKGEQRAALRYPDGELPAHRDPVWVRVANNGRVDAIRRADADHPGPGWWEGWVLVTNPNINHKKAERVFVLSDDDEAVVGEGAEADRLHRLWSDLIRDYQITHEKDIERRQARGQHPAAYFGPEPGQTAWSRHVYTPAAVRLSTGALVYVRRDQGGRVTGLYPVSISRDLYAESPLDLLDKSLRPARSIDELSPADRVFGWVNQSGKGGYRGNVRVGPVTCDRADAIEEFGNPGLPLAILGQPKPQQSRFYAGAGGTALPPGTAKEDGYRPGRQPRGRKAYPHHGGLPDDYWAPPPDGNPTTASPRHHREYLRPRQDGAAVRDSQNRSVRAWVKPGTEFAFDLRVTNLSAVELGALVWLLALPDGHFHRLGGGKPLGFGSVRLRLAGMDVRTGQQVRDAYMTFDDPPPAADVRAAVVAAFERAVAAAYGGGKPFAEVPFVRAFRRACTGFADGLPTHYPRDRWTDRPGPVPPNPRGESYEWFVANEAGPRLPLPDLAGDPGLPVLDRRGRRG